MRFFPDPKSSIRREPPVPVNVPALKVVSSQSVMDRWSDYIGQFVGDSHHLGPLSTILKHFTYNETQWPTAAHRWHFALRDISCRQKCHLSTPSHSQVPPVWPYCWQAQCEHWFTVQWSIADLLTSNVSLPFAWITGLATDPSLFQRTEQHH